MALLCSPLVAVWWPAIFYIFAALGRCDAGADCFVQPPKLGPRWALRRCRLQYHSFVSAVLVERTHAVLGAGACWLVVWVVFAASTPADHPTITQAELEYIQVGC